KMKRQLLDEEAAIAQAQQRIAILNNQTSKIVNTNPATVSDLYDQNDNSNSSSIYQLSYLAQQAGQWSATLSQGGHYEEVTKGSVLSDGMQVEQVTKQGVILEKNDQRMLVTFNGIVPLPAEVQKAADVAKTTP